MATPTPHSSSNPPHDRGVFIEDDTFPGLIAYRVYACNGRLMEAAYVSVGEWDDPEIADELRASLDRRCPPSGCDGAHRRYRRGLHIV